MTKTLGEILDEAVVNMNAKSRFASIRSAIAMNDHLSCMTDFELSVWEDIIDFAEDAFGLNKYELIADGVLEPITRKFWASKLN